MRSGRRPHGLRHHAMAGQSDTALSAKANATALNRPTDLTIACILVGSLGHRISDQHAGRSGVGALRQSEAVVVCSSLSGSNHPDAAQTQRRSLSPHPEDGVFASSCLLLIRGILAALRQKFHLSGCPNLAGRL
jgi:hypothetical protein